MCMPVSYVCVSACNSRCWHVPTTRAHSAHAASLGLQWHTRSRYIYTQKHLLHCTVQIFSLLTFQFNLIKFVSTWISLFCFSVLRNVQEGSWIHHDSGRDRHSQALSNINVIRSSQGSAGANLGISQPHNTWHADQGGALHCTCTNWRGTGKHWSQDKLST